MVPILRAHLIKANQKGKKMRKKESFNTKSVSETKTPLQNKSGEGPVKTANTWRLSPMLTMKLVNNSNFTKVDNAIVDQLMPHLSDAALRVLMVLVRKTVGWHKEIDAISLSQWRKYTGRSRHTILKGLKELEALGILEKTPMMEGTKNCTTKWRLVIDGDGVPDKEGMRTQEIAPPAELAEIQKSLTSVKSTPPPTKIVPISALSRGEKCQKSFSSANFAQGGGANFAHTKERLSTKEKITPTNLRKNQDERSPCAKAHAQAPRDRTSFSPKKAKEKKKDLVERARNVQTSPEQHQALIAQASREYKTDEKVSLQIVQHGYEKMSSWKDRVPKSRQRRESDYGRMRRWGLNAGLEKLDSDDKIGRIKSRLHGTSATTDEALIEKHVKFANRLEYECQKYPTLDACALHDSLELGASGNTCVVYGTYRYDNPNFVALVQSELAKRGFGHVKV